MVILKITPSICGNLIVCEEKLKSSLIIQHSYILLATSRISINDSIGIAIIEVKEELRLSRR